MYPIINTKMRFNFHLPLNENNSHNCKADVFPYPTIPIPGESGGTVDPGRHGSAQLTLSFEHVSETLSNNKPSRHVICVQSRRALQEKYCWQSSGLGTTCPIWQRDGLLHGSIVCPACKARTVCCNKWRNDPQLINKRTATALTRC